MLPLRVALLCPPWAPSPPAPIPFHTDSPASASYPPSCADCAPSARKIQTLQGQVARLERLLVLERAGADALEQQVAVALSVSTTSALSARMSTGDGGEYNRLPIVIQFLKELKSSKYSSEANLPHLQLTAATVSQWTTLNEIWVKRRNGRLIHYVKVIVPQEAKFKTRLAYERLKQRALHAGGVPDASVFLKARKTRKRLPARLPVGKHVGTIADNGISSTQYKKIRRGFGGSESGLASLPAIRAKRRRLETLESKIVGVNTSGAHLVGLRDAVQEKVAAVWDALAFVERLRSDKDFKPIKPNDDFVVREQGEESVWSHSHPASVKTI